MQLGIKVFISCIFQNFESFTIILDPLLLSSVDDIINIVDIMTGSKDRSYGTERPIGQWSDHVRQRISAIIEIAIDRALSQQKSLIEWVLLTSSRVSYQICPLLLSLPSMNV